MNYSNDMVVRYLFGELSETKRAEMESQYFDDPQAFDRLVHIENDLIDDYVRGRLVGEMRERFERAYLSDPSRRARLKFGKALSERTSRNEPPIVTPAARNDTRAPLFSWLRRPAFAFSLTLAFLVLVSGAAWLLVESNRLHAELALLEAARVELNQRERELQQQLDDEQRRNHDLTEELNRISTTQPNPSPEVSTPAFVTLLLVASGIRGVETPPPILVIPKGAEQVRIQLTLKDQAYQSYQISLQAIGGAEVLHRENQKPGSSKSGAIFSLWVPASKLSSADYILTLRGASQGGEFEDVSKSLFRVEKK